MEFPHAQLIVFAKAPVPGQVKTRLMATLGAERAASLHERLAWRTVSRLAGARLCPVSLWCAPDCAHPFFQRCADELPVVLLAQQGVDLGERMGHALQQALAASAMAVIVGTDCPGLDAAYLRQALHALRDHDAVVGPAEDGGYVLLGLRRFDAALFSDIEWGGPRVLDQTRRRLTALEFSWAELAPLWDVDRPQDLHRLHDSGMAI